MHSLNSSKPIGKCKQCALNMKRSCGVFAFPAQKWARGTCRGFMNELLYAEYVQRQSEFHAKTSKELRRERARNRGSEPHYNGLLNPGGGRW